MSKRKIVATVKEENGVINFIDNSNGLTLASSNLADGLPLVGVGFINAYNREGKDIKLVRVEIEGDEVCTREDGTVIVSKMRSYSRSDMLSFGRFVSFSNAPVNSQDLEEWETIKENHTEA